MNRFKERGGGPFFSEYLWIKDEDNLPMQAILEADSLESARIVDSKGELVLSGSLEFRRGIDEQGRATRILLFVGSNEESEPVVIYESVLSARPK